MSSWYQDPWVKDLAGGIIGGWLAPKPCKIEPFQLAGAGGFTLPRWFFPVAVIILLAVVVLAVSKKRGKK